MSRDYEDALNLCQSSKSRPAEGSEICFSSSFKITCTWITLLENFVFAENLGGSKFPESDPVYQVTVSECEKLGNKSGAQGSHRITYGAQSSGNFLGYRMAKDEIIALTYVLTVIATTQFNGCSLVVAFDATYEETSIIQRLISLPHTKQVLEVTSPKDFSSLIWESSECRGYFFLIQDPKPLYDFLETGEEPWDFQGKYVFVGLSKSLLNRVTSSPRGKKTQHITGLVRSGRTSLLLKMLAMKRTIITTTNVRPTEIIKISKLKNHQNTQLPKDANGSSSEWLVYMNRLYLGDNVVVNRWRDNRFTSQAEIFPDKISNLKGASLTLITFEFAPHVLYGRGKGGQHAGRDIQVALALSKVLNFTLKWQEPPPGELWGSKLENGTWTGLVAALENNVGHIGMANIFLSNNNDRTLVQGFTRPYDADRSCFMARTDPPLPRWQSLALPFLLETWLAVVLGLLLFCPLLYVLGRLSGMNGDETRPFQSVIPSTLYIWGIHFRISQVQIPKMAPTRLMVVFLWLYAMILTTAYSSNLTAFLTVARPPRSIETIRQLYSSGQEILGMGYFFRTSLASSGNVYIKNLVGRYHGLSDFEEALTLLKGGRGVFLESRKYLEYLISTQLTDHGIPQMRIMKECYAPYSIAIATQKNFPLKKSFDRAIGWISESGLVRRWFLDVLNLNKQVVKGSPAEIKPEKSNSNEDGVIPLAIDHVQGLFYILLISHTLSTLVFSLEILCCKE